VGKGDGVVSFEGNGMNQSSLCVAVGTVDVEKGNGVQQMVQPSMEDGFGEMAVRAHSNLVSEGFETICRDEDVGGSDTRGIGVGDV
jgi:hypothetical protein